MIVNLISDKPNSSLWSINNNHTETIFESTTRQLVLTEGQHYVWKKDAQELYKIDIDAKDKILIDLATLPVITNAKNI